MVCLHWYAPGSLCCLSSGCPFHQLPGCELRSANCNGSSLSLTRSGPDRVARNSRPPNIIGTPAHPPTPEIKIPKKTERKGRARILYGVPGVDPVRVSPPPTSGMRITKCQLQRIFSLSLTRSGPDRVALNSRPPNIIGPPAHPPTPEIKIQKKSMERKSRARILYGVPGVDPVGVSPPPTSGIRIPNFQ